MMSLFGSSSAPAPAPAPKPSAPVAKTFTAYDANGLRIVLAPQQDPQNASVVNLTATFTSTVSGGVQGINFQAAVPKTQKLQMLAISSADIDEGSTATQRMRVMAPPGVRRSERMI